MGRHPEDGHNLLDKLFVFCYDIELKKDLKAPVFSNNTRDKHQGILIC